MYDLQPAPFQKYNGGRKEGGEKKEKPRLLHSAKEAFQFAGKNIKSKDAIYTSHTPIENSHSVAASEQMVHATMTELVPWNAETGSEEAFSPFSFFSGKETIAQAPIEDEEYDDYEEDAVVIKEKGDDRKEKRDDRDRYALPVKQTPRAISPPSSYSSQSTQAPPTAFRVPAADHSVYYPYGGSRSFAEPAPQANLTRIDVPFHSPLSAPAPPYSEPPSQIRVMDSPVIVYPPPKEPLTAHQTSHTVPSYPELHPPSTYAPYDKKTTAPTTNESILIAKLNDIQRQLDIMNGQRQGFEQRGNDKRAAYAIEELAICIGLGVAVIYFLDKIKYKK